VVDLWSPVCVAQVGVPNGSSAVYVHVLEDVDALLASGDLAAVLVLRRQLEAFVAWDGPALSPWSACAVEVW
jgi:hypothetical protein